MKQEVKEYTLEEAKNYIKEQGKKSMLFYRNVFGWDLYYTLSPTFATPTGANQDFRRTKLIKS